jgi:CelD/BcsL family acetyltransferase involved in cellulose biosynthesis
MAQAVQVRFDAPLAAAQAPSAEGAREHAPDGLGNVRLAIYEDLAAVEPLWRAFEREADGSVFQTYEWLATWQRHIGERQGVRPAIVVVCDADGAPLALFALGVRSAGFARELAFLGSELCDYNGPLLAPAFSERFDRAGFLALWAQIERSLQAHPRLAYDFVRLTKMPELIGAQFNPMRHLAVTANPSGAYLTHLAGDWESFYTAKRSSATRRRDRTKRKRLSDMGAVHFVTPQDEAGVLATLDTLMAQKGRAFARMGVADLFARPGYREFYRVLATNAGSKALVHVSRLDVGATPAAINFGLIYRGRYYHLQASYDEGEVSRFGPGAAHLHDLMQYAIEHGCDVFDFTIGDERYKRDWCDTELKLYDHVAAANWRGALIAARVLAVQALKRRIKQTPVLWAVVSKARALLGALRGAR